jgi:hypothetical protein
MPRLLRDVTRIVCEPANVDSGELFSLIVRLHTFRAETVNFYTELDSLTLEGAKSECVGTPDADERTQMSGDALSLIIMGCRMLSALSMDAFGVLEIEALAYSNQLVNLERKASTANSLAGFALFQKLVVAQATLNTTDLWRKDSSQINRVERSGYKAWCDGIPVRCSFS